MPDMRVTEGQQFLRPVWTPADYREVFERAATVAAVRSVADESPVVRDSAALDFILKSEGLR